MAEPTQTHLGVADPDTPSRGYPQNARPPLSSMCRGAINSERRGHHSLKAGKPPPIARQPPAARRRATAVTLPPHLTLHETKASWTEAAVLHLHAPVSSCAYPSLPVPLSAPSARLLANVRHGRPIHSPALSLPGTAGAQSVVVAAAAPGTPPAGATTHPADAGPSHLTLSCLSCVCTLGGRRGAARALAPVA